METPNKSIIDASVHFLAIRRAAIRTVLLPTNSHEFEISFFRAIIRP